MLKNIKKILVSPWTALITLAFILSIRIADPVFIESVRLRYFDTLITNKAPTENNIVTVNIDESALEVHGQWPFKRDVYANLIENLYRRGAGLVVFNVLMTEPDRQGGDGSLAATLNEFPVIIPNMPADRMKNVPRQPGTAVIGAEFSEMIVTYPGIIANIKDLESRAKGVGVVNTLPEVDGVNRRMPLLVSVNGRVYPSLAMEALRVSAGDSTTQIKLNENGVEKMRIPKFGPITTDSLGRVWIDWSQRSQSVSMTDLPKDLQGAVVIVGVAAAGLGNPVPSAVGSIWPHEVQAAVLGTMFNNVVIERPDYAEGLEIITLALAGILLIFLTRFVYAGLATTVILIAGSAVGSWYVFNNFLWLFDATAPGVGLILVALHAYGVKFVSEFLQKQQIKKQFGTYLSPAMVEKLSKNPDLLKLGGESRELSIMFTDVRGFTSISEHYGENVQGLTQIMNRYMTAMTAKIIKNEGTLDKYIGDAQMAFWNAPLDDPDHAKHAVATALEMLGDLDAFNEEISKEGVPAFGMGLGINTATVVVGNMGSDQRFDYTCLGDGVNLASRLEGQSKPYGVKIVLGPQTADQVKDDYPVCELDCIAVKGKKVGVKIYTIETETEEHRLFLESYYMGRWTAAKKLISSCKAANPNMEKYYDAMAERLAEGKPVDWDGTYRATSK